MTQCNYDGMFYRVFCVTLLAIAFTFTVILTNVFIDIDGMLANKEKENPDSTISTTPEPPQDIENNELFYQPEAKDKTLTEEVHRQDLKEDVNDNEVFQPFDNQDPESYGLKSEIDEDYRTKRSIDTPNKLHLANSKMKEILNNRLSTLLEELDAEEAQAVKEEKLKLQEQVKPVDTTNLKKTSEEKDKNTEDSEILHLAIHNILLQGIIGHMDLNEVYNKVHDLVQSFEENDEGASRRSMHGASEVKAVKEPKFHNYPEIGKRMKTKQSLELLETPQNLFSVESKLFDELVRCDELQKQISTVASTEAKLTRRSGSKKVEVKAPKMLIKTIIDIKTMNRNDKQNNSYMNVNTNNIKGLIKLIYNGKSINFSRLTDDESENKNRPENAEIKEKKPNIKIDSALNDDKNVVDTFLDKALAQYLKKYPKLESKFRTRRPKRSVKVHKHSDGATTEKKKKSYEEEKPKKKNKPDEEELYVEIETHFDSKGHNGEKKKKLIKAIIAKIQKALRVNIDSLQKVEKTSKKAKISEMLQIKKRIQNPLKVKEENILSNKITLPVEGVVLRKSEPISKSIKLTDPAPKIYDKMGEIWKKTYTGSSFLSNSKSINSGEMGLVDLDYSRVGKDNGIPQRLQQPLNTDSIDQVDNSEYYNLGDLKFYIKEIDGTGFSIGFNQYVGDAPNPESVKLFTGLQQLINVYNENSDNDTNSNNKLNFVDGEHEVSKRDVDSVSKLSSIFSSTPKESHSNEYKVVFDDHLLPYDSYSKVFEDGRKKVSFSIEKEENGGQQPLPEPKDVQKNTEILTPIETEAMRFHKNGLPFIIDENLFMKPLKPSEIFGLADLLNRKKRSPIVKIKKYSNIKTKRKSHLNRYLNTKRKVKRIVKNKRNKRQIDKIRIIATDSLPRMSRHSDENFYVVSDENMFADRAVVREMDMPEQEHSEPEERSDFVLPHHMTNQLSYDIFGSRSRHNALMSKYPHLFLEEITRSKEDDNMGFYNKILGNYAELKKNVEPTPSPFSIVTPYVASDSQNTQYSYANIYDGSEPKPNYKLTVRIIPKNQTDIPTGFKSVHTSINKTINRNGVLFLSQVNVSELSKVENSNGDVNKQFSTRMSVPEERTNLTETPVESTPKPMQIKIGSDTFPLVKHIKEQQEKMKMLLRQHKQRIDEQLDNLKLEKQNIDSMIIRGMGETTTTPPVTNKPETIDVLLPLNPPQMLHLNKDEAGRLISNALMKLHDAPHLNDITEKNQPNSNKTQLSPTTPFTTTTQATTTITIPPTQLPKITVDPERIKLLRTIQRNENLTNVILYKIDRNTNLLHHFLQKLTDRLEPTHRPEYIQEGIKMPEPKEWKTTLHVPIFPQNMPNMEVNKNATHISMPFVYAYQQPYPLPAANNLVASVMYQGHIHTNAFNKAAGTNSRGPNKLPDKREANNTKFFLGDVVPGFKVVSVPLRKQPYDIPRVKNNITTENNII